jgi:hypothetical protein
MRRISAIVLSLTLVSFSGVSSVLPQTAEGPTSERWVEYRNGEVSLDFDRVPVDIALKAIRAKTGVDIVVPSETQPEFFNLQLSRLPLEPAVRFLLVNIGVENFALMYDEEGRPNRAVALWAGSDKPKNLVPSSTEASNSPETTAQQLTAEERDRLLEELERWNELNQEERNLIEKRLKAIPPSETREQLVKEYGQQVLGIGK